jgi:hypothetical protein
MAVDRNWVFRICEQCAGFDLRVLCLSTFNGKAVRFIFRDFAAVAPVFYGNKARLNAIYSWVVRFFVDRLLIQVDGRSYAQWIGLNIRG